VPGFVALYRLWRRWAAKAFSLLAGRSFASFGRSTVIEPPVRLVGEARIDVGSNVFVGAGSWLQTLGSGRIEIGDGCSFAGSVTLSAALWIRVGSRVLMARNVYIADHVHAFTEPDRAILDQGLARIEPVEIGDGAWLGQNVVVCPGVRIGRGAVIGAKSVVRADVPDHAVAVGAPARVVRLLAGAPRAAAAGGVLS
jgi:acetyltransferase-like isoleucine patch superfamily enzyme